MAIEYFHEKSPIVTVRDRTVTGSKARFYKGPHSHLSIDRGWRTLRLSLSCQSVQIMAAGGEYVVPREAILHIGEGNLRKGHIHEDKFVKSERAKLIKTLRKLPGPAQS